MPGAVDESRWVRWRYPVLAGLLLLVVAAQAVGARWSGDFWLHAAVVEAVADDPLSPANPTQSSDATSPLVSPYTVLVGAAAALTGVDAVTALGVASVLLVAAFVLLLPPVVVGLTSNPRAPFWTLLGTLVLWGADPLRWSGYLNLTSLVSVSPYPAMAAWCGVLAAMWALLRLLDGAAPGRWATVLALAAATVTIVHPLTVMTLALALGSIAVGRWPLPLRSGPWRPVAAAAAASAVLVACWPAYRVWDLASGGSSIDEFHDALYEHLLTRSWPLLAAVPLLVWRARTDRRDPLVVLAVASAAAAALGWIGGVPTVGRVLPLVGLAAHTAIGDGIGRLETRPRDLAPAGAWRTAAWTGIVGLVLLGAWNVRGGVELAAGRIEGDRPQDVYAFARGTIADDDVVLAPPISGAYLAGLGEGRPVATVWEERLSDDDASRRADVLRFYAVGTDDGERAAILERWAVDVVLVDRLDPAATAVESFLVAAGASTEVETPLWSLWRVDGEPPP